MAQCWYYFVVLQKYFTFSVKYTLSVCVCIYIYINTIVINSTVNWAASLQRGKTPTSNRCAACDIKPFEDEALVLKLWVM